jgi:glucose 1-dehydrogenase
MSLSGKVAIITGGTSGVGRATAERFVSEGARVVVVGRDADHGAETVAALLAIVPDCALFVAADIGQTSDIAAVVNAAVARFGRIDILVNNAATMTFTPILELAEADWDRVLDVNLKAAFLLAKHAVPHMASGGAIVNVSSVHAVSTSAGVVPYAASKGGLEAFTRGLAVELKPRGIRVNAVRLGAIDTPMLWSNPNVKSGAEQIDPSKVGTPANAAAAILFLAAPDAAFVTGAVLEVDGGRLASLG